MKSLFKLISAATAMVTVMMCFSLLSNAAVSDIYTYTVSGGAATITAVDSSASGAITIPEKLGNYPVTKIGPSACRNNKAITSLVIPDTVTEIQSSAFNGCTKLKSVDFGDGVVTIGDSAFYGCSALTELNIGLNVDTIGNYAFHSCTTLTVIRLNNTQTIGKEAFRSCTKLTGVAIPPSVKTIGENTFYECKALRSVTMGSGLEAIAKGAFRYCSALESVSMGSNVKTIGEMAFLKCEALKEIEIPKSVTLIQPQAFNSCRSLTNIKVHEDNEVYTSYNGDLYTKDKKKIVQFAAGKTTATYRVPSFVEVIGENCYGYCDFVDVIIPDSVITIESDAFEQSGTIKSVKMGKNVKSIGTGAFFRNTALTDVQLNDGLETIGISAFEFCSSLKNIEIPESVKELKGSAFAYSALTEIYIPDSVEIVDQACFSHCTNLKKVRLPEGILTVHIGTFYGCKNLVDCRIPSSVKYIKDYAFKETGLKSVVLPEGLYKLYDSAFNNCDYLTEIYIPDTVKVIGRSAFDYSESITRVYYEGTSEDWAAIEMGRYNDKLSDATRIYVFNYAVTDTLTDSDMFKCNVDFKNLDDTEKGLLVAVFYKGDVTVRVATKSVEIEELVEFPVEIAKDTYDSYKVFVLHDLKSLEPIED